MSHSSFEVQHRREPFHIDHEPFCDRCGHGVSLHTLKSATACVGCGERMAAGYSSRPMCVGFASAWFDNSSRVGAAT